MRWSVERQVRKEEGPGSLGEQRNCSLIKTEEEKKKNNSGKEAEEMGREEGWSI